MKEFLEGSQAIAKSVKLAKPGVICAYPITPQTHIVEELANSCANGELIAEFVNVESEHSAASVVLGATAAGVRSYTSSSSQGLILMSEVLFNIAGLRLPTVLCCVNRSVSAPINIWNDHQDSMVVRDSGFIQFYAETIQEAFDFHLIAYRLSENHKILLPSMVCIDGYTLSHGYEIVDIPSQEQVDEFLPPYQPLFKLDPSKPLTMGVIADPNYYMETRYAMQESLRNVGEVLDEILIDFEKIFGRKYQSFIEKYRIEDAQKVIIAMGSICGTIKETINELRAKGEKVGLLKLMIYRPFSSKLIYEILKDVPNIAVIDKAISIGSAGPLYLDVKTAFQGKNSRSKISGFICGLGGRDVTKKDIIEVFDKLDGEQVDAEFINIKKENIFDETKIHQ